MQYWQIATLVAVIVVVIAAGWLGYRQSRSHRLRSHFGPEYDRTVTEFGDCRRAETELARREERIRKLHVLPLSASDRGHFAEHWRLCQAQFVDDPAGAVDTADQLLTEVFRARGYAADSPDDRLADISAAYPQHVSAYRIASEIAYRRSQATTEDLRKAFVNYRQIFDQILGGYDAELKRAS